MDESRMSSNRERAAKLAEIADEQDDSAREALPFVQALAAKSIAFSLLDIAESTETNRRWFGSDTLQRTPESPLIQKLADR